MDALIDNDVLFKGACYGFLPQLISPLCSANQVGVLGAAWFVVSKKIGKTALRKDSEKVLNDLREFMRSVEVLEPTEAEQSMAAEFELAAQRVAVSLNTGESQLCAVLIARTLRLLITGDKRAITAIDRLMNNDARLDYLSGRIWCIEQLVLIMLSAGNGAELREAICGEPSIDMALSICFSCRSESGKDENAKQGLESYIADLRSRAMRVLAA
jgi:hypothetical protein